MEAAHREGVMRWGMAGAALLLAAACGRVAAADPAPQQAAAADLEQVAACQAAVTQSSAPSGDAEHGDPPRNV